MVLIRKSELKHMAKEEMNKRLLDLRKELMKLRSQSKTGTAQNPGKIRVVKRTIAMILTKLKIEQEVQKRA